MAEERDAADHVKRETPVLVVLGNPPYNAFAGVAVGEESDLVDPYKKGLIKEWAIKKFNLDDLYVRFFRLAERKIAEMKPFRGVVSFISNHSWLSDPSFVVLRQHLLSNFDRFWIDNMHGDRKISEYGPDGKTSETVFAIRGQSIGIQQGTAISLWVKSGKERKARILFRNDINASRADARRRQLLSTLDEKEVDKGYEEARPAKENRFSFRPESVGSDYALWPRIIDLSAEPPSNGLMEKRGGALMDFNREALAARMRTYFDRNVSWETLRALGSVLAEDAAGYDAAKVRRRIPPKVTFEEDKLCRYALRPFDTRWCYYSEISTLWNRSRPALWKQVWSGNKFLLTRFKAAKSPEGSPFYFTSLLSDDHFLSPDAVAIPVRLRKGLRRQEIAGQASFHDTLEQANLSEPTREWMKAIAGDLGAEPAYSELVWYHCLAIGYSPKYLAENGDGVRGDWPHIPLPTSKEALLTSASLGRRVADLLDTESEVEGVTVGAIRPELLSLAMVSKVGGGQLDERSDLALTAGWGYAGKEGATMPGRGRLAERALSEEEKLALTGGAPVLGGRTLDVFLNDTAYWKNIPLSVWEYYIGGYQVVKKWLSYREKSLLGRDLLLDEARYVTQMVRRLAAILLLEPDLNENYRGVKARTYHLPTEPA